MTEFLPTLLWRPSPNFSSRRGMRVDLIILHDCEGGYEGSIRWFEVSRSNVSAHYVVREDGGEVTQMVDLADDAWHACTFNRRSVGVEMSSFASRGFDAPLLASAARMFAYLCIHVQIPVRHARAGVGPGIAAHNDLGAAGGGHHDPSDDPLSWRNSLAWSTASTARAIFPTGGVQTSRRSPVCFRPTVICRGRRWPRQQGPGPTFTRSAVFNKRLRCSDIALPSTAITAPKRGKPSRVFRCTRESSLMALPARRPKESFLWS
jgi:hypothetical protein